MILVEFFQAISAAFTTNKKEDARFGNTLSIATPFNSGLWIGKNRRLPGKRPMNVAIFGPPGSGKTSTLIFPMLYTLKQCSLLVTDVSGELFEGASGYQSHHFAVRAIHLADPAIGGYNPIANIEDKEEVHSLIDIVVDSAYDPNKTSDNFWALSVKSILTLMTMLSLHQPREQRNFGYVLELVHTLSANPKKIDAMVARTSDQYLITRYLSFISNSDKTMASILQSAKAALILFDNSNIARATATTEKFDFQELRRTPTVIYLLGNLETAQYTGVLVGLFFEQFYRHALKRIPAKKELSLYVLLEETPAYYIKILPLALSNGRKHRVSTLCCCQTVAQLQSRYGKEAPNITANCGVKIFLHSQTCMDTLKEIETLSGTRTVTDEAGRTKTVSLISASEVRTLPKNRTLIIAANKPIIKGYIAPYWHNLNFRRYAKIPPIPLPGLTSDEPVALLA
jgi:type IV secretion system protein VirD4